MINQTRAAQSTEHLMHILHHDSGYVGDYVYIVFGVVGEASAGHKIKVFGNHVMAFGGMRRGRVMWSRRR